MKNDLLRAAEHVTAILAEQGSPSLVIGAIALAAHRYIRFTHDIDLAVVADVSQMQELTKILCLAGYEAIFYEPDAQDPLGGVIDVTGPFGLIQIISFAERFPAAIHDALLGEDVHLSADCTLRVIPIPQLIALKLYAGGHKAKADIIELLKRNPELERDHITQVMKRYRLRGMAAIWRDLDDES